MEKLPYRETGAAVFVYIKSLLQILLMNLL